MLSPAAPARRWALLLPLLAAPLLSGCGAMENDGVRGLRELIDAGQELVATFKSVRDPESARRAAPQCEGLYGRMIAAQKRIIAHEREHGETRGLKTTIEKLQRDLQAMQVNLEREAERLGELDGLPEEFWTPIREGSYTILGMSMRYAQETGGVADPDAVSLLIQASELYEEFGAEKLVEMEFLNLPRDMRENATARLNERLGNGKRVIALQAPETGSWLAVAGPSTMDEVAEAVDFADVQVRDDGQHMFEFQVSLRALDPERWAPRPGQTPSPEWPLESREAFSAALEEHGPQQVVTFAFVDADGQPVADAFEIDPIVTRFRMRSHGGELRRHGASGWVAPVDDFDRLCRHVPFGEVIERDDQAMSIKIRLGAPGGMGMTLTRTGRPASFPAPPRRARASTSRLPDAADPDYHQKLCDMLTDPSQRLRREEAVDALLSIDPQEIADAEVRKQLARNFRKLALEERFDLQGKAVRGLAKYAGRYSIPVLCEMVDKGGVAVHDEVFNVLALANDTRAAESVAGQLGEHFTHDRAVACLRKMGGVAEPALMEAARSGDAEVSLAAIELLGEVGGRESLDLLRQAVRANNQQVSAAARSAMRQVRERMRGEDA